MRSIEDVAAIFKRCDVGCIMGQPAMGNFPHKTPAEGRSYSPTSLYVCRNTGKIDFWLSARGCLRPAEAGLRSQIRRALFCLIGQCA